MGSSGRKKGTMVKLGDLIDREVIVLARTVDLRTYLQQRRLQLSGPKIKDFAAMLGIHPQQATDILAGRSPFGPTMISRLNAIDIEFEVVDLVGVLVKNPMSGV